IGILLSQNNLLTTSHVAIWDLKRVSWSKWKLQRRHLFALLAFFGFVNIYAMRANLSVAIVQMTSNTTQFIDGTLVFKPEFGEWDSVTQGTILSSFFYGYILTQVPGGYLAHRHGGKLVFLLGVFGTAVLTILTPPLAHMGKYLLIAARFSEGMLEGVTYPAMHVLWIHWATPVERTQLASFAFSGAYIGTVFAMVISAILGHHFGWPLIFYFFGCLAFVWCFIWIKYINDSPGNDQYITTEELTWLQKNSQSTNYLVVPWNNIFTSKSVWAIVTAHFCENWGFYTMLTSLPRILSDLMNYELEKAGFFAALPYFLLGIVLIICGNLQDILRDRYMWSTVKTRKYFCCLGFICQAIFISLAAIHAPANVVMLSVVVSIALGGLPWSAFSVNHLDIAPQYAGHLMGLSNTIATLPGMFSPIFVGFIMPNEWHIIFLVTAGIYLVGAFIYWRCASGEIQNWASFHERSVMD
ncbi:unnamed protein product, partial [Dracunculus medinensis]|uniref:Sialin n=1 Tax=Dracunculus medinensis TaxID=318479 RepID=A0A0N4U9P4_DRAME